MTRSDKINESTHKGNKESKSGKGFGQQCQIGSSVLRDNDTW